MAYFIRCIKQWLCHHKYEVWCAGFDMSSERCTKCGLLYDCLGKHYGKDYRRIK